MNYLIAGLGNIGKEYEKTRHNVGFMVLDVLAEKLQTDFVPDRLAYLATATYKGRKLFLIKPTTYMNLSGKAVQYHINAHKVPLENLLVITDDIAIDFGTIRIRTKGSDGGHNGLKNIQDLLQTTQYPRMRIGVGNQFSKGKQVDYVLGNFSEDELPHLSKILQAGADACLSFVFHGISQTMNQFNKSSLQA